MSVKTTELIREGGYLAEVDVELKYDAGEWSPSFSIEDALKLEAVRKALRNGDLSGAGKFARVFELRPIAPSSEAAE
jgi:hypothetical protein